MSLALAARARFAGLDPPVVTAALALVGAGLVLALSASPSAAGRMGFDSPFHFAWRQAAFALIGVAAFAAAASLSPVWVRRAGLAVFAAGVLACLATLIFGVEVKGARRWLDFGPVALQPVELLKPGFIIAAAWALALSLRRAPTIGAAAAMAIYALCAALLLAQPDFGQTALLGAVLVALLILAAAPLRLVAGVIAAGAAGLVAAYAAIPHVRARLDAFLSDGPPGYQVGRALDAIAAGGVLGRGPGEGVVKDSLPDAHSDFIFAVAAEEFGLVASVLLLGAFAVLVGRGLMRAARLVDPFAQFAAAGLFTLIALQAAAHVAVNLSLAPAKGMTLPFVSYGGSSMLGAAVALGFACALTRRRPGAFLYGDRRG